LNERISFVVSKRLKKALKELQELTGEDQSTLLRKLANKGLSKTKMDIAVEEYVKERASLEQSSAIAGVSLWKFLDELQRRNVSLKYSIADAESEISETLRRTAGGK
jgi:predicted HTH domain antitoxin